MLDPAPRQAVLEEARSVLSRSFPAFARMQVAESWGGMIDVTPDAVPVIGEVPSVPGFFLAPGFSGHGFGIGPGAGRLTADLVAGDTPVVDPAPFRLRPVQLTGEEWVADRGRLPGIRPRLPCPQGEGEGSEARPNAPQRGT